MYLMTVQCACFAQGSMLHFSDPLTSGPNRPTRQGIGKMQYNTYLPISIDLGI